jgi:hypothetical protein
MPVSRTRVSDLREPASGEPSPVVRREEEHCAEGEGIHEVEWIRRPCSLCPTPPHPHLLRKVFHPKGLWLDFTGKLFVFSSLAGKVSIPNEKERPRLFSRLI